MGMDTLRRQLASIKAQLDAACPSAPVACADAFALWRLIYEGDPDP
jgi:hypothetical protein